MPKIEKPNKKKLLPVVKTAKKSNLPTKSKSTHDYYCCCAEQTKQGIPKGTKITQLTKHCKQNSKKLAVAKQAHRETEKKKILDSWKQIGLSLGKIIDNA